MPRRARELSGHGGLLRAVAAGRERGLLFGAGTIITPEQLHAAADAGAAYVVSPGLDPQLIALAEERGMPMVPGVATASEILQARNLGLTWLKAFPASVPGAAWFTAMLGPFSGLKLVATVGVTGRNAADFLAAGAFVIGVGGAFGDPAQLERIAALIATHVA